MCVDKKYFLESVLKYLEITRMMLHLCLKLEHHESGYSFLHNDHPSYLFWFSQAKELGIRREEINNLSSFIFCKYWGGGEMLRALPVDST